MADREGYPNLYHSRKSMIATSGWHENVTYDLGVTGKLKIDTEFVQIGSVLVDIDARFVWDLQNEIPSSVTTGSR